MSLHILSLQDPLSFLQPMRGYRSVICLLVVTQEEGTCDNRTIEVSQADYYGYMYTCVYIRTYVRTNTQWFEHHMTRVFSLAMIRTVTWTRVSLHW